MAESVGYCVQNSGTEHRDLNKLTGGLWKGFWKAAGMGVIVEGR